MYKKRINLIFVCALLALMGFAPGVFAVDLTDSLDQSARVTQTLEKLFGGKMDFGNSYQKSLRIVRQNESFATQQAISSVAKHYIDQSCAVTNNDVLRVLYASNLSFKNFFDHLVFSTSEPSALPSIESITASYNRFFACYTISYPTAADYSKLERNISSLYYQSLRSSFFANTLAQNNYGEDLFWNGNPDDGFFDVLVDINELGNLMFTTFTIAPQTLFYTLPASSSNGGSSNGSSSNGGSSSAGGTPSGTSSSGPGAAPSGGGQGSSPAGVAGIQKPGAVASQFQAPAATSASLEENTLPLIYDKVPSSVTAKENPAVVSTDADVQQFLTTTNPSSIGRSDYSFVLGNLCVGIASPLISLASQQEEETITEEAYLSGIEYFIDHANINDDIHDLLLSGFLSTLQEAQKQNPNPGSKPTATPTEAQITSVANTYSELVFGDVALPGSCEAACTGKPLDQQMQCQLDCAKSCIQKCDNLPLKDKILCVVDCTCRMVSGPTGEGWKGVEDMYNIKFCKVPAPASTAPKKKTVSVSKDGGKGNGGLQAILQSIADALQGLKSSGKTIKMKKTKEFLEIGIQLKLKELLDFKIDVAFKGMGIQKTDAAKKRQKVLENAQTARVLTNTKPSDVEDYNKYIVVADVAKDKANLENTPVDSDKNLQNTELLATAQKESYADVIALQQKTKNALLDEHIIKFLAANDQFLGEFIIMLTAIQQDTSSLKSKIEKSK